MLNRDETKTAFNCCTQLPQKCECCPFDGPGFGIECKKELKDSVLYWLGTEMTLDSMPTVGCWISVKDSPPLKKGWYLVYAPGYFRGSSRGLANHNGIMFSKWNGKVWSIEVGYHERPGCVKYYMPLPDPPREDND